MVAQQMRIMSLKAENVKRIHLVELDFNAEGGLTIIGGKNEQGKSSTLDSLAWLIGGKKLLGPSPIREGEKSMTATATLQGADGKLIITRTMTHKSDSIKITGEDGRPYPSPQALLDDLTNTLTFDPLEFSKFDAKKQGEVFMDLVGLDFGELNNTIKLNFDERTIAKRLLKQIESTLEPMQEAVELIDVSALSKELGEAHKSNSDRRETLVNVEGWNQKALALKNSIEKKEMEIRIAQEFIAAANEEIAEGNAEVYEAGKNLQPLIDTDPIQSKIDSAGEINARHEHNKKMTEIESRIDKGKAVVKSHDDAINNAKSDKSSKLASAKVPIADLGIDDDGLVTYKGFAFSQCSSAEKLRVSFAIVAAMNPKLKLVMIRDGAYLDSDNLKAVAKMAKDSGMNVLMERVGDSDEEFKKCSVIIDDGRVQGA